MSVMLLVVFISIDKFTTVFICSTLVFYLLRQSRHSSLYSSILPAFGAVFMVGDDEIHDCSNVQASHLTTNMI